ncbi:MAG: 8-oxoguanine DNA glycosylase [Clostridiales Family XIII bacterium]|jgi:N-glycosylase/DNA lyase|nr:8-oxoguanine DNA glycosylase [Clostridiales Family XIII bacterium]
MSGNTEIIFKNVRDFSLERIFECGQAFRWKREDGGGYKGVAGGRAASVTFAPSLRDPYAGELTVTERGRALRAHSGTETGDRAFWENYFDLKRDYGEINRALSANDETMARAIACGEGIRILNQDAWETLISFIISQNNNIPRIKGCIERLCKGFGERIECAEGELFFDFPNARTLASLSEEDLAPCGLGYRAKYLCVTARQVAKEGGTAWLDGLRGAAFSKAKTSLLSLCGVGEKVASCILLFGLGQTESFPLDVWMNRALSELYGIDTKNAVNRAAARFGPYAGIAQQYIFYYMRKLAGIS